MGAAAKALAPPHLDYGIELVDEAFASATGLPVGMPLLRWADGSLCEPVVAYAHWRMREDAAGAGTVRAEVYAIREWVARFAALRRSLWKPDDDALEAWRTDLARGVGGAAVSESRAEAKLGFVFRLYSVLPRALPWDEAGRSRPAIVVLTGTGKSGGKRLTGRSVDGGTVWARARPVSPSWMPRPTPDPWQVRTVLTRLRRPTIGGPGRRGAEPDLSVLCADRDFCIGSIQAEGGLRADEAAGFGLPTLWDGLRAEADLRLPDRSADWRALDAMATEPAARDALLHELDSLKRNLVSTLYFRVRGKGSKERLVEFPIGLVRDLLGVGVFQVRRRQFEIWRRSDHRFQPPPNLFLSFKSHGRLTSGAIGDIVAAAFNEEPAIPGSGHRLRGYYATMTAIRIWRRCLDLNNRVASLQVEESALGELRDALGHARVNTTLRYYLSLARFYAGRVATGTPEIDALTGAVSDLRENLSPSRASLAARTVTALGAASDEEVLCQALDMLLGRLGA
jgi:integrase